ALLDELDELLGTAPVRARPRRDPFHVADGVREVTTYADRMAAARAVATERPEDYRDYAHVVVDEAQDVSPMQWRQVGPGGATTRAGRSSAIPRRRRGRTRPRRTARWTPRSGRAAGTSTRSTPTTATPRRSSSWPPR